MRTEDSSPKLPNSDPMDENKKNKKNKRKLVVYVSGLYSRNNKGEEASIKEVIENIHKARKTAIRLWEEGYTVITPHLNTALFGLYWDCKCTYNDYLEGDLELVRRSDILYMLKNWGFSKGAIKERELALQLNIPIIYET